MSDPLPELHDPIRWEAHAVPRHIKERLMCLAALWAVDQAEALAILVQSAEGRLPPAEAQRYERMLRRRVCAPKGTDSRAAISSESLPPLPEFQPPLGTIHPPPLTLDGATVARLAQTIPKPTVRKAKPKLSPDDDPPKGDGHVA